MRIFGIIPARMESSRFPGKPLYKIAGRPMIEHVFHRAKLFPQWDALALATCNGEIADFAHTLGLPVIMTSNKHTRCLDRIAEAAPKLIPDIQNDDLIVCVQGDEPLLHPDMIKAAIRPCLEDKNVPCTVLAMDIIHEEQFRNKDTVKIIHDMKGDVLYTSRSPIPYCTTLTPQVGAKRIYGIFAFRWHFLKTYTELPESPLEIVEACDSNRILDNGFRQRIAPFEYRPSFSVDVPADVQLVEKALAQDPLWGKY